MMSSARSAELQPQWAVMSAREIFGNGFDFNKCLIGWGSVVYSAASILGIVESAKCPVTLTALHGSK